MVKLDNSDGDSLKLLCFQHHLLEDRVLDDLVGDNRGEMARFSHIPPVITVEGRIQVVSQALGQAVKLDNVHSVKERGEVVGGEDLPQGFGRASTLQDRRLPSSQ